ncbi:iron-regulated ABC transporter atp-binding protein [Candidatus Magnetomorum sp. HK-1]|nr:iron-regulated ABC transporter atp-binding protein [Candidatus Magnetomorum sp. HK-1]
MLVIEDLGVEVGGKQILNHINMEIPSGETHILFGPNGSGKTSLMMTIMGFSGYKVTRGKIIYKGNDITNLPVHERARLGIGVAFQRPPTINGLKTRTLVEMCHRESIIDIEKAAETLLATEFLERDVNDRLSGGEIKRSELLQLMAQQPDLILLDEPESGVDLESMAIVGEAINMLLNRGIKKMPCINPKKHKDIVRENQKSALVITHTGHILNYITADKGQVLFDGVMCCRRNAREILKWIDEYGYRECVECMNY